MQRQPDTKKEKEEFFTLTIMHINIFDMNLVKEIKVYDSIVKSSEFAQNHWLDDENISFDQID